ncbi:MAG: PDZ domain-containing protein [Desulfobulbaceae bacterium]|nr:PDZ domain-containing protein [Desulfobulbaceae bacterium]
MPTADFLRANLGRLFNSGKTEKLLRLFITLALLLMVARTGADLSWQLATPLLNKGTSVSPRQIASQIPSIRSQPYQNQTTAPAEEIALFGLATGNQPLPGSPSSATPPPSTLGLVLKGIVAVRPMRRALAVIAERAGATEQLYGQGEELPGNAVIREIHPDKVIISRGGVLETLLLDGLKNQATNMKAAPAISRATSAGNNVKPRGDGTNWQITQDYWQEKLADIPGLAREVGVEVYKENDQQKGFRLVAVQNGKLLTELGLQTGDVLLSVNGRAMNSVQEGLAAYQQVKSGGQVTIEINRGGHRETRAYNVGG